MTSSHVIHAWLALALAAVGCARSGYEQRLFGGDPGSQGDPGPQTDFDPTTILDASYFTARRFGGTGADQALGIAPDSSGGGVITGSFSGTVDFGDGPRVAAGGTDVFVLSFDPGGALDWVKTFGSAGDDEGRSVVVDNAGVVSVVGTTSGSINIGCGATGAQGTRDIMLVQFDAAGSCVSSRTFGAAGASSSGVGVALGAAGDVVLAASIGAPTGFGGSVVLFGGVADAVVVRFDPSGGFAWARGVGSTTADFASAIAVNGNDEVILSGSFTGQVSCAGTTIAPGSTGRDVFLIALAAGGADLWCKGFVTTDTASSTAVATDSVGNVYLAGDFMSGVDMGGGGLTNAGNTDAFIASYTSAGAHRWSHSIGGAVSDHLNGVVVQADAVLWLVGFFALTVDFGSSHLVSNGSLQDIAILTMGTDGTAMAGWSFGGTAYDFANSVALVGASCVGVTGRTDGDVDFGGGVLASHGGADAFLLELCW